MIPNIRAQRPLDGQEPDLIPLEIWRASPKAAGEIGTLPAWDIDLMCLVTDDDMSKVESTFPGAEAMIVAGRKSDAYKDDRVVKTRMADVELHLRAPGDRDSEVQPIDLLVKAAVRVLKLVIRGDSAKLTYRLRVNGSSRELGPLVDHLKRDDVEGNLFSYQPQLFGDTAQSCSASPEVGNIVTVEIDDVEHIGEVKSLTEKDGDTTVTIKPLTGSPLTVTPEQVVTAMVVDWGELDKRETLQSFKARTKRADATGDWGHIIQAVGALLEEGERLFVEGKKNVILITASVIERAVMLATAEAAASVDA